MPAGPGRAICIRAPTVPWRRPARRSKTLSRIGSRVHHWARGVDVTGFARRPAVRRCGGSGHRRQAIVGFVGRLALEKHVERLAVLAGRDDVQVVIVGDGVDRGQNLKGHAGSGFTGALYGARLATAYASMDVFVHPGEHETFCQTVQGGDGVRTASGRSAAGGPIDLVTPIQTGILLGSTSSVTGCRPPTT